MNGRKSERGACGGGGVCRTRREEVMACGRSGEVRLARIRLHLLRLSLTLGDGGDGNGEAKTSEAVEGTVEREKTVVMKAERDGRERNKREAEAQ
jgi:hypothetical protein